MKLSEYWDKLTESNPCLTSMLDVNSDSIATEDELQLITDINGYSFDTLNDVLYARTGYRFWGQWNNDEEPEYE